MKKITSIILLGFVFFSFYNASASKGKISGEIHYAGEKTGMVIVAAFNLKFDFNSIIQLDTLETGPDFYQFDSLNAGSYLIAAFMDINGDGLPGFIEPLGAHPRAIDISDDSEVTNVDVYLNDLPRGSSSILGTAHYKGQLPGRLHVYALGLTATPFNFHCPPAGDSTYTISGLLAGEYVVVAFLDVNDNGFPDMGEPVGYIDHKIEIGNSENSIDNDFELFEPQNFAGSIYGTINYTGSDTNTIYIYTIGLTHTPIRLSKVKLPETSYEVNNLDQGEYLMFAFLDSNNNHAFDPRKLETKPLPQIIPGEPYELIAEPIALSVGERKEQNLFLNDKGDAGISGKITYEGEQGGLVLVAAVGLSPVWFGLTSGTPESLGNFLYTIPELDAGLYGVIGVMVTDISGGFEDLNKLLKFPIGYYTKDLVCVTAHDTVKDVNFILQDSTTATSEITGTITTPEGVTGDIYLFSVGLSLTPYWHQILTTESTYTIDNLRMGRYLVGGFMDVNGDGTFELDEPFAITESLIEIPQGDMIVVVDLVFKSNSWSSLESIAQNSQPDQFILSDNYPNPFNPTTNIEYHLSESRLVTIKVFNLLGNEVRTLVRKHQLAGQYQIIWDGKDNNGQDVSSGVYLYCLKAGDFIDFKEMTLIR